MCPTTANDGWATHKRRAAHSRRPAAGGLGILITPKQQRDRCAYVFCCSADALTLWFWRGRSGGRQQTEQWRGNKYRVYGSRAVVRRKTIHHRSAPLVAHCRVPWWAWQQHLGDIDKQAVALRGRLRRDVSDVAVCREWWKRCETETA